MLQNRDDSLAGKRCLISGSGNVAIYAMEKLYQLNAKPITCSDSRGTLFHDAGIDLTLIKELKEQQRGCLSKYKESYPEATYIARADYPEDGHAVWRFKADAAFPCATQNELTQGDAKALLSNGCILVSEGANMPSTKDAIDPLY